MNQPPKDEGTVGPREKGADNGLAEPAHGESDGGGSLPDLEPLSLPMIGRLFGVPFIIVSVIVGGAILVVVLFAGPTIAKESTVDDLLRELEGNAGEKSAGILLPREKRLWQTALELGKRLDKRQTEFTEAELETIAERLTAIVRKDIEHKDTFATFGQERTAQQEVRNTRLQFVIRALGRTGRASAVAPLIEVVEAGVTPFTHVAIQELGNLHGLPQSRAAVDPILAVMERSQSAEELLSCATVLSVLADTSDPVVIKALDRARLAHAGEVEWAAALGMARLGSSEGKSTLADMLSREFWETDDRYQVTDESGQVRRYRMPPQRVNDFLIAAIDAAAHTSDPDLWELIDGLKSDSSSAVRGRAVEVVSNRVAGSGSMPDAGG
ncbi:MAG: HEAT repeat domain-containing protein [Planctomycetota bacterium]|jgi:hypothetical protein